jgi:hypothetical protein
VDDERLLAADVAASARAAAPARVNVPPNGPTSCPRSASGRDVFGPEVWPAIDGGRDPTLTGTIRALMERERVFACLVDGHRFDCGTKLGYLEAQFAYAHKRRELWPGLRLRLDGLLADEPAAHDRATALGPVANATAAIMR